MTIYRVHKSYKLNFFFQAEDCIRDGHVTGVQTCALPILQGYNVLHPMGWDAFGLPAEQYAIDTGNDIREFNEKNIDNFRRSEERRVGKESKSRRWPCH